MNEALYYEDLKYVAGLPLPWEKLQDSKILVTGATGMIGRFLSDVLMFKNEKESLRCNLYVTGRSMEKLQARFSEYKDKFETEDTESECKEFDKVVMMLDEDFYYDDEGDLRHPGESSVRRLFHGMSRAKKDIALVIKANEQVFDVMLFILQR